MYKIRSEASIEPFLSPGHRLKNIIVDSMINNKYNMVGITTPWSTSPKTRGSVIVEQKSANLLLTNKRYVFENTNRLKFIHKNWTAIKMCSTF